MKKIATFSYLLIVFLTVLFVFSQCKSKKHKASKEVDSGFSSYIKAFPLKTISNSSELVIKLFNDVPNVTENQEADQKLIDISPSIKGRCYWQNAHTFVFDPEDILPSDKLYQVDFQAYRLRV